MNQSPKTEGLTAIAKELIEPVYNDLAKPAVSVVGGAVGGLLRFVCLPFTFLGMTAEQLETKYRNFITQSVDKIPEIDRKTQFDSNTAKSVSMIFEQIKFCFDDEETSLYKMYSDLLAKCISVKEKTPHPFYITILSEFTPFDAVLFQKLYLQSLLPPNLASPNYMCFIESKEITGWCMFAPMPAMAGRSRGKNGIKEITHIDLKHDIGHDAIIEDSWNNISAIEEYITSRVGFRAVTSDSNSKGAFFRAGANSLTFLRNRGLINFTGNPEFLEYPGCSEDMDIKTKIQALSPFKGTDMRTVFCLDRVYGFNAFYEQLNKSKAFRGWSQEKTKNTWDDGANEYSFNLTELGSEFGFMCALRPDEKD